jgi:spoIIIJ-associated protein
MEFKEITAKTVDEAITKACLEFETSSDNLEIQVVQEGTSGFLGFIGSKPAVIKVRKKVQEEEFDILKELAKEEKKEKKAPVKEEKKEPKKEIKKESKKRSQTGKRAEKRNCHKKHRQRTRK